jgi:AcrR family transcriptional regulator
LPQAETRFDAPAPDLSATASARGDHRTKKFRARQAEIVHAANRLINRDGVKGMTLADVAATLGIVPTGVIYYFSSKEELAACCFMQAISTYEDLIRQAEVGHTRAERLRLLVKSYVALRRDIALGAGEPLTAFGDLRGLGDPGVTAAFIRMFLKFRALLQPVRLQEPERRALTALALMVLSQLFWASVWLERYNPEDYERAAARMLDILEHGIGAPASVWRNLPVEPPASGVQGPPSMRENLLRSATDLINEQGYHGASAEKIAARLNLTKGAFYHHIDAKDDLVLSCFQRTVDIMRGVQREAGGREGDGWSRLSYVATALVEHQIAGVMPLLRTSALNSAPPAMKTEVIDMFDRVSLNFGSMICDGIADGSLRPVDAHIAAHMITATINAAAELELWVPGLSPEAAASTFVRPLFVGMTAGENHLARSPA